MIWTIVLPKKKALAAYSLAQRTGLGSSDFVRLLCSRMERTIQPVPAATPVARQLFLLRAEDVSNVIDILDELTDERTGCTLFRSSALYMMQWRRECRKAADARGNSSEDTVCRYRDDWREHVHQWRLQWACRDALLQWDVQEYLYDVDPRHCPATPDCYGKIHAGMSTKMVVGPTQSQLDVIRGLVPLPRGPHLTVEGRPMQPHPPPQNAVEPPSSGTVAAGDAQGYRPQPGFNVKRTYGRGSRNPHVPGLKDEGGGGG